MSKRKQESGGTEDDVSDVSLVDIEFDFFDPNPEIDYLAVKRLANQLWQGDAAELQVQDLADLILTQPRVGTTVKCDGKESDPYAFLTVVNLHAHKDMPFVKALVGYVLDKSSSDPNLLAVLRDLLGPKGMKSSQHVGFIFSERLVNMPVQLVPPMYRMLQEEIQWAVDGNEPFRFSHYLFLSQTYKLSAEDVAELEDKVPPTKKKKGTAGTGQHTVFPIHPEDEQISQFASHSVDFAYTTALPRDNESFGLDTGGRLMLLPAEKLPQLVNAISEAYPAPLES